MFATSCQHCFRIISPEINETFSNVRLLNFLHSCYHVYLRLILLILIKKSVTSLETEISSLIFRLEEDDDDLERSCPSKALFDNDVDSKLIPNSIV